MWGLLVLVGSIALADCVNPTTVVPGAMLATRSRRALLEFTAGVFLVSFLAGAIVVIGPGPLILGHVPRPHRHTRHVFEVIFGVVLLVGAVFARRHGARIAAAFEETGTRKGSSFAMGAGIMLAEITTALPYFAALAAILASGRHLAIQVGVVALYNVLFVLPLLVLAGLLTFGGQRADRIVDGFDHWLRDHVATMLLWILAVASAALLALGVSGLLGR